MVGSNSRFQEEFSYSRSLLALIATGETSAKRSL